MSGEKIARLFSTSFAHVLYRPKMGPDLRCARDVCLDGERSRSPAGMPRGSRALHPSCPIGPSLACLRLQVSALALSVRGAHAHTTVDGCDWNDPMQHRLPRFACTGELSMSALAAVDSLSRSRARRECAAKTPAASVTLRGIRWTCWCWSMRGSASLEHCLPAGADRRPGGCRSCLLASSRGTARRCRAPPSPLCRV